jgi:hypothetical protein
VFAADKPDAAISLAALSPAKSLLAQARPSIAAATAARG